MSTVFGSKASGRRAWTVSAPRTVPRAVSGRAMEAPIFRPAAKFLQATPNEESPSATARWTSPVRIAAPVMPPVGEGTSQRISCALAPGAFGPAMPLIRTLPSGWRCPIETRAKRKTSATRWQMNEWIDARGSRWRRRLLTSARRERTCSFLFASVRSTPTAQRSHPSTG